MQTQNYIRDGVILETSRRVPDSWSSDAANVKMDLKSVTVCYSAEWLYDEATHRCMKPQRVVCRCVDWVYENVSKNLPAKPPALGEIEKFFF